VIFLKKLYTPIVFIQILKGFLSLVNISLIVSCSTPFPRVGVGYSPQILFERTCQRGGAGVESVQGWVTIKANVPDFFGQFSAAIFASASRQSLQLELTNLLGGTEAYIRIQGDRYQVMRASRLQAEGRSTWNQIPLHWIRDLFLGKVPCPSLSDTPSASSQTQMTMHQGSDGELILLVSKSGVVQERFTFYFELYQKQPWPQFLHWEQLKPVPVTLDLKWSSPDEKTGSSKRWEVQSAQGKIQVRWTQQTILNAGVPDQSALARQEGL